LESAAFIDSAKAWALEKLAADLAKALSTKNRADAKQVAFLPVDSNSDLFVGQHVAEAWYVEHRPEEYQNLFLKMMFDRSWVDSLSTKVNPCADLSDIKHTVMLFVKTLEKDLSELQDVLYRFQARILETTVSVDFDAACTASKISQISGLFNELLRLNEKPEISEKSPAALQIAFDDDFKIKYIAYSETPDCLCDEENINAYILKKGVEDLKTTPPLDTSTVNAFLYYLPEIIRKYSPYLNGAKSKFLFAAQESWVQFIKSYVFPVPEVVFDTSKTSEELFLEQIAAFGTLSDKVSSLLKRAAYTRDPTMFLAPEQRALLKGMANGQVAYGGDAVAADAIASQLFSLQGLYDRLLNRIPILELVKVAAMAIIKCTNDGALQKALCKKLLKAMPQSEIDTKLIPCLQSAGASTAANSLRTTISGRKTIAYEQAKARYPDKFTKSTAQAIKSEDEMDKVNGLYCSDPAFQKMLGRPIDDFSEELLLWLEKEQKPAICECIMSIYTPIQQLFDFMEDLKDDAEDIADIFGKNKAQQIESTTTYSFKNTFAPFEAFITNETGAPGKKMTKTYTTMMQQILLAAVIVVLNHVKSEYIGGLLRDACNVNANPFSKKSIINLAKNSPLHSDKSFQQMKKTIKKMFTAAGLSGDIKDIMSALDKLGEQFTASEFKRLFTTPCSDNSFEDGFRKARATLSAEGIRQLGAVVDEYGTPTDAAVKVIEAGGVITPDMIPPLCPAPKTPEPTIGSVQTALLSVGSLVDPAMFEDIIDEWDKVKDQLINLCDPVRSEGPAVPEGAILRLAAADEKDLIGDILGMLPLLDPEEIENMMPPIFCGPCSPSQVGKEPLMPNQSHPSELVMLKRGQNALFETVNDSFNNSLDSYKPIILGIGDLLKDILDAFKSNTPNKIGKTMELNLGVVSIPLGSFTKDRERALRNFAMAMADSHDKTKGPALVAKPLIRALEEATSTNLALPDSEDEFIVFEYTVPDSEILIMLMVNYSEKELGYKPNHKPAPGEKFLVPPNSIKIVASDRVTKIKKFEWPDPTNPNVDQPLAITLNDEKLTHALIKNLNEKVLPGLIGSAGFLAKTQTFRNQFPIFTNLIFENILKQGTSHDLFKAPVFNKIPFTDAEMEASCIEGAGGIPLLNIEKVAEDVDAARQALECVVGAFAQPTAEQIATIYGMYKILMKVCIIEEYLKNIFSFGFMRVSDVIKSDAYRDLVKGSIKNSVNTLSGQKGYDNLLKYSAQIINGRQQLGEIFSTDGGIIKILTPEKSFEILIEEAAAEVDDILEARVKSIIDPGWTKEFFEMEELGEEGATEPKTTFMGRVLEYAINTSPEYWSPDLYPHENDTDEPSLGGLKPMRNISNTPEDAKEAKWAVANNGKDWPDQAKKPSGAPWEGGLFFQPYMKITSKITNKGDFWDKFIQAEIDTRPYWEFPDSSEHTGLDGAKVEIDNAIGKLIEDITAVKNITATTEQRETVNAFFDLVFKPEANASGHKFPFMRVVSSFLAPEAPPKVQGQSFGHDLYYYWPPKTENIEQFIESNKLHGIKANLLGSHANDRWHWANRGIVATHRIDRLSAYHKFEVERIQAKLAAMLKKFPKNPQPAQSAFFLAAIAAIQDELADVPGSPIKNHIQESSTIIHSGLYQTTPSLLAIVKEIDYSGFGGTGVGAPGDEMIMSATEDLLVKLGLGADALVTPATPTMDPTTPARRNVEYAEVFWNRIRNIIFDSAYSKWFDFKIGMRLNLLTPMENVDPNFFSDILALTTDDFAKYNDEKTFIWQRDDQKYFCFPIDQVEEDVFNFQPITNGLNKMPSKLTKIDSWGVNRQRTPLGFTQAQNGDPTLWAAARAIDDGFFQESMTMLNVLKIKLAKRVAYGDDIKDPKPNEFLTNVVPIKELLTTNALFYRYYMEEAFPSLNRLFDPTKGLLVRMIAAMIAAADGDYSYLDELLTPPPGSSDGAQSPTDWELAKKFMLLFVQMAANMFDPTWQTPWFLPGPLTPIGIVAKALLTDWSDDKDKDDSGDITQPGKVCPPALSITAPEPSLVGEGLPSEAADAGWYDEQGEKTPGGRYLLVFPEENLKRYFGDTNGHLVWSDTGEEDDYQMDTPGAGHTNKDRDYVHGTKEWYYEIDVDQLKNIFEDGAHGPLPIYNYGYTGTQLKLRSPSGIVFTGVVVTNTIKLSVSEAKQIGADQRVTHTYAYPSSDWWCAETVPQAIFPGAPKNAKWIPGITQTKLQGQLVTPHPANLDKFGLDGVEHGWATDYELTSMTDPLSSGWGTDMNHQMLLFINRVYNILHNCSFDLDPIRGKHPLGPAISVNLSTDDPFPYIPEATPYEDQFNMVQKGGPFIDHEGADLLNYLGAIKMAPCTWEDAFVEDPYFGKTARYMKDE